MAAGATAATDDRDAEFFVGGNFFSVLSANGSRKPKAARRRGRGRRRQKSVAHKTSSRNRFHRKYSENNVQKIGKIVRTRSNAKRKRSLLINNVELVVSLAPSRSRDAFSSGRRRVKFQRRRLRTTLILTDRNAKSKKNVEKTPDFFEKIPKRPPTDFIRSPTPLVDNRLAGAYGTKYGINLGTNRPWNNWGSLPARRSNARVPRPR